MLGHRLVGSVLFLTKYKVLIEPLKCVSSECILVAVIKSQLYYPLNYLENKSIIYLTRVKKRSRKRKRKKKSPKEISVMSFAWKEAVDKH